MSEIRKYFVRQDWIFNLESMHDKLFCILYDIEDGKQAFPLTIAGKTCRDEDDIQRLIDECDELSWTAKSGRVTSKEYGRIKAIVEWRVSVRYAVCMASGMNERDAARCFEDL